VKKREEKGKRKREEIKRLEWDRKREEIKRVEK
jgi:hypothetical protein